MELACSVAIDPPEAGGNRLMAMMLAMSLVRSQFDGDVVIFWSGEVPGRTVGGSDAAAWCVTECGECDARIQHDPVRLVLAVKDEVPNKAVEVRNQRPAGVVEAVMSDRCLAATGEMCVAGGANGPYFNSAAQAS